MSLQTKVDVQVALRAYQRILDQGVRDGEDYILDGLRAGSDFDGYSVFITDQITTARVMFHSKLAIEAPHRRALVLFNQRIEKLVNTA